MPIRVIDSSDLAVAIAEAAAGSTTEVRNMAPAQLAHLIADMIEESASILGIPTGAHASDVLARVTDRLIAGRA